MASCKNAVLSSGQSGGHNVYGETSSIKRKFIDRIEYIILRKCRIGVLVRPTGFQPSESDPKGPLGFAGTVFPEQIRLQEEPLKDHGLVSESSILRLNSQFTPRNLSRARKPTANFDPRETLIRSLNDVSAATTVRKSRSQNPAL
jgi:hypothetical protein